MDNILVITNHADDTHVTKFAYQFALQNGKDIIEAQMSKQPGARSLILQAVSNQDSKSRSARVEHVDMDEENFGDFNDRHLPNIKTMDASRCTERKLAAYIRRENCSMVIASLKNCRLNLQVVLNHISCPMMILPDDFEARQIKRIVYLTDLRYCQQPVVSQLAKFKKSSVLLAHICQQGLPDLMPDYGKQLFVDSFGRYSNMCELFFSHIKETNFENVVDTLTNTMGADLLVCSNRMYHFQKLLGDYVPRQLPDHIAVPLLIFPC
ncbi:hypothetical protein [Mucilaginibacter sp. HD30]